MAHVTFEYPVLAVGTVERKQLQIKGISLINSPLSTASASMTASIGGGSTALARNGPISPNFRDLILRANSCSGVRNISAVECSSNL